MTKNHEASASRTALAASRAVAAADFFGEVRGRAPKGFSNAGTRGHVAGGMTPISQFRTAVNGHVDCRIGFSTLWPVPGTTTRCPCGKRLVTEAALAVGVRKSSPPLNVSTGTFGSGPPASGALPDGEGHRSQKYAVPRRAAQVPNGPKEPAGRAATAAFRTEVRSDGGVVGAHGKCTSAQVVAAYSPKLRSSALRLEVLSSRSKSRSRGRVYPSRAARIAAGSSDWIPGLRSLSMTRPTKSSPFIVRLITRPPGAMTVPTAGLASRRLATVTASSARFDVMPRHRPPEQRACSVWGIACITFRSNGSGSDVGRTESRIIRSTEFG